MPSNHLILCHPLLLPPSIFPSIRVFSNKSVLCIRWPKCWSFSFNIRTSNEGPKTQQCWKDSMKSWAGIAEYNAWMFQCISLHSKAHNSVNWQLGWAWQGSCSLGVLWACICICSQLMGGLWAGFSSMSSRMSDWWSDCWLAPGCGHITVGAHVLSKLAQAYSCGVDLKVTEMHRHGEPQCADMLKPLPASIYSSPLMKPVTWSRWDAVQEGTIPGNGYKDVWANWGPFLQSSLRSRRDAKHCKFSVDGGDDTDDDLSSLITRTTWLCSSGNLGLGMTVTEWIPRHVFNFVKPGKLHESWLHNPRHTAATLKCEWSSPAQPSVTPWTVDAQAPLSVEFSRQEHWRGLPFLSPGDLPNPGIESGSPASQADSLLAGPPGKQPQAHPQRSPSMTPQPLPTPLERFSLEWA